MNDKNPVSKIIVLVSTKDMQPMITFLTPGRMSGHDKQLVLSVVNMLNSSKGFPKLDGIVSKQ